MAISFDPGGMFPEGLTAKEIIRRLALEPHPEGGHYRETYRHVAPAGGRGCTTAIYYLLAAGETSAWHRVDAVEIWHYHAGAPLALTMSPNGHDVASYHLGIQIAAGQQPQVVVPANAWQTAVSMGRWTLVGCTVSPAFEFAGFELAPKDWKPSRRKGREGGEK